MPPKITVILNILHVFKTRLLRFACGATEVREVAGGSLRMGFTPRLSEG